MARYESNYTDNIPHKKSGGQLGGEETTADPSRTDAHADEKADRGERTAENIRYGQTISEGGMGGMTAGQTGTVEKEGYGRLEAKDEGSDGVQERVAGGHGGAKDMDRGVGG